MTLDLVAERYDGPGGSQLVELVQAEYVVRYGGRDRTPVDPAEFLPPDGVFLVAYVDGEPCGCGGFRNVGGGEGEIKRMYVDPARRGRGIARALLAALEDAARGAGCVTMRLETGAAQPEAIGLYLSSGYTPIPSYGYYRDFPTNRCFGKAL